MGADTVGAFSEVTIKTKNLEAFGEVVFDKPSIKSNPTSTFGHFPTVFIPVAVNVVNTKKLSDSFATASTFSAIVVKHSVFCCLAIILYVSLNLLRMFGVKCLGVHFSLKSHSIPNAFSISPSAIIYADTAFSFSGFVFPIINKYYVLISEGMTINAMCFHILSIPPFVIKSKNYERSPLILG